MSLTTTLRTPLRPLLLATALFATALGTQAATLTALYTFEGANGSFANVTDASGNGKNPNSYATGVTVTTGNGGYQGEAVKFTLVTDNPQYSSFPNLAAAYPQGWDLRGLANNGGFTVPINITPSPVGLTIGGWLKLNPNSTNQGLHTFFSQDNGGYDRGVWYDETNNRWQVMGGSPKNTAATFTADIWHSMVVTFGGTDGGDTSIYIDGLLKGTARSLNSSAAEPNLRFGAYDNDYTTEPWSGLMDNLFVFTGALTANEVATINSLGLAGIQQVGGIVETATGGTVPEPGSLALAALALGALATRRRRAD